jgi:hypothetical protein
VKHPQGTGWKVVSSFEAILPKRIKGLPLDSMFEMSSIKKVRGPSQHSFGLQPLA